MWRSLFIALVSSVPLVGLVGPGHPNPLPLGDGKIAQRPTVGHVLSCRTTFFGGGAHRRGAWIKADTWDPAGKPVVDGEVRWPAASITVSVEGDKRVVRANNLPRHATGQFPISPTDDAYRYDRNPNSIREQEILLTLPAIPVMARVPVCVPMGMVGFALTGAAIYNALDAQGRDAPAYEIQDACNGHPQRTGQYHYHDYSRCLTDTRSEAGGHSDLVGYAIDGYGIYGLFGEGGEEVRVTDLDACHGHTHTVRWDGTPTELYHYHFTAAYPYTMGCLRGVPSGSVRNSAGRERAEGPGPRPGPGRRAVLRAAAQELGVPVEELRAALGPPPPDFAGAARRLGIEADRIRTVLQAARQRPPRSTVSSTGADEDTIQVAQRRDRVTRHARRGAVEAGPPIGTIRVTLLGTGGGPGGGGSGLLNQRMNATTLVEAKGKLLVFDAGRGLVIRLSEQGRGHLSRADKIFITHLHSDHVTDLPDIFLTGWIFGRQEPLRIWGPRGTRQMMFHLRQAFDWDIQYRSNARRSASEVSATDVTEGIVFDEDGVKVTAFDVDHWPPRLGPEARGEFPALGYRVDYNGRSVLISGDTRFSENLVKFAQGVDMLIHEVHAAPSGAGRRRGSHHPGPGEVGTVFNRAQPKLAVFSHIVWGGSTEEELISATRKVYGGPLVVGNERMQFLISDKVQKLN